MPHVEPIEARCLFAVTPTPDPTFADGGRLSFSSDNPVNDVVATGGEIYVRIFQRARGRMVIFKYTDAGTLDTKWGRGGYIVPMLQGALNTSSDYTMVRDGRTGGLLVGVVQEPDLGEGAASPKRRTSSIAVERYAANGKLDTAWGRGGRIRYSEDRTLLALPRLIALPHKKVIFALNRAQQRGDVRNGYYGQGGAADVALLKFDAYGRYDRTFNGGHALTVAAGNYKGTFSTVDPSTDKFVQDSTVPAFGDVQFFADDSFRVVSMREETHETRTTFNIDVITYKGTKVESAESIAVSADGRASRARTQSYVVKRLKSEDDGLYRTHAAVASADGKSIALLVETGDRNGKAGGSLVRVGPGYRSKLEHLPAPLGTRYMGPAVRTGSGVVLAQSSGTSDFSDDENETLLPGPGVLSLGRDLAVGRNRVLLPLTYFPQFSIGIITLDDKGRLLTEGTNTKTNTFDVTRYA